MYKKDLAINDQQWLLWYNIKLNKTNDISNAKIVLIYKYFIAILTILLMFLFIFYCDFVFAFKHLSRNSYMIRIIPI